jgi:membrane protein
VADTSAEQGTESLITRLRAKYRWLDHLMEANEQYTTNYGNQFAAAITYFSILSLIPILMVAFAIVGIVLANDAHLLGELQQAITTSMPGALGDTVRKVVNGAIAARATVGVVGLVVALYSGIGWMSNLRDALTAQWGQDRGDLPLLRTALSDLLALIELGIALAVSFAITVAGSGVGAFLLRLVGLDGQEWARVLLVVFSVVLSLVANWLVFLWVIARLPRQPIPLRRAIRAAWVGAIGFEILKQAFAIYLDSVTASPTGKLFGPVIGLMVFAYFVSRFLLFLTAWAAVVRQVAAERPHIPAQRRPAPADQAVKGLMDA